MRAAPKSWSKYTTGPLFESGIQFPLYQKAIPWKWKVKHVPLRTKLGNLKQKMWLDFEMSLIIAIIIIINNEKYLPAEHM